ncbi:MAG: nucleoside-diphosphate kinase [Candidatus Peribacteraceae bacterium]|nr:nucleoside-diphosphate kinase [Candidatus Peribacteraceae bacterium]
MQQPEREHAAGTREVEHTLLILKPDAVEQDICLHVLHRIVHAIENGRIRASRILRLSPEILRQHYAHIVEEPFYPRIEKFMLSSEVWVTLLEGKRGSIEKIRELIGATDPRKAAPGTIRAEFGKVVGEAIFNVVHASDSEENAEREIRLFFLEEEIRNVLPELADRIWKRANGAGKRLDEIA